MNHKIISAVAVLTAAVIAPISSAAALGHGGAVGGGRAWSERAVSTPSYRAYDGARFRGCPMNSASEGNANQQNFPVKQYGQTTGGNRC